MIYRHTQQQIDDYFERDAFNQSSAKAILKGGIQLFKMKKDELIRAKDEDSDMYYEEKPHFIIGSAVDCKITMGEDVYNDRYFSSKMRRKPSPAEMSMIRKVFDEATIHEDMQDEVKSDIWELDKYKLALYESMNYHEYRTREMKSDWREDNRMANLLKKPSIKEYWNELIAASDKQILSDEETLKISDIYLSWTTHPHTAWIFQDGTKNTDTVYQFPMYWEYEGEDCKGLPDILFIHHDMKRIMPINLKTTSSLVLNFNRVVEARRYDIGESFYYHGLIKNLDKLSELIHKNVRTGGYHVSNGAFVVESTTVSGTPMIYPLTDRAMEMGMYGNGVDKLGWMQAMTKYKMWKAVDFRLEEMFKDTNGVVWIDENYDYEQEF